LLDEKLKLHERIIDEFNLTALEKMPPEVSPAKARRSRRSGTAGQFIPSAAR
jgi:hypothetical protein